MKCTNNIKMLNESVVSGDENVFVYVREALRILLFLFTSNMRRGHSFSSFQEQDSGSYYINPICEIRRVIIEDVDELKTLITPSTIAFFGDIDIYDIIQRSIYSLVAVNSVNHLVAFMCLHHYPNIPALPPSCWEKWIYKLYNLDNTTPLNSAWLHYMAYDSEYAYIFLKPMLTYLFMKRPTLLHILVVEPGGVSKFEILEETFTRIMPIGYSNPKTVQTVLLSLRYTYMNKYKIRLAVEEDNDDIIPLVNSHTPRLKEMYGDYYVSEILARYSEYMDRRLIVAEHKEKVAAVIFLNGVVNYKNIVDSFAFEPYFCELEELMYLHRKNSESTVSLYDEKPTAKIEMLPENQRAMYLLELNHSDEAFLNAKCEQHDRDSEIDKISNVSSDDMITKWQHLFVTDNNTVIDNNTDNDEDTEVNETIEELEEEIDFEGEIKCEDTFDYDEDYLEKEIITNFLQAKNSAFSLEIMAATEEHEEMVLCDILEASFQSFPEKNLCLLTVPHTQCFLPLFDYFNKLAPKRNSIYPHELFVLHKNTVNADMKVRKIREDNFHTVNDFLMKIPKTELVRQCVELSLFEKHSGYKTFLFLNGKVIIGLAVLRDEYEVDLYLAYYQVYKYVDYNVHRHDRVGLIEHCIFSPIFQKYALYFVKELHRQTDMTILFHKIYKIDHSSHTRQKPLSGLIRVLVPIPPRTLPDYSKLTQDEYVEVPAFLMKRVNEPFALFLSTPRLSSLKRLDINSRIVVVGTSNTGLAFIENLIFQFNNSKIIRYSNLTVVYERGLRDFTGLSKFAPMMMVHKGRFSPSYLQTVCYRCHLNYFNGSMTAINRKNKYITINYDEILPYDYLFLTCGKQYHAPYCEGSCAPEDVIQCPSNVYVVNKYRDAEESFLDTIIIYGSSLNAYCCIATLQNLRIPDSNIIFVESFPDENERPCIDCFNNTDIYEAIHNIIKASEIRMYSSYYFSEWQYDELTDKVTSVEFQSRQAVIELQCDAMFYYSKQDVGFKAFTAVNSAGLVYDGKLVIGPDCSTNDPYIFAAGPMTKYSRRYFADNYVHQYYDSFEIGMRLARHICALLSPGGLTANPGEPIYEELKKKDKNKLVPLYEKPIFSSCILPGKINYFDIRSPGKPVPFEIALEEVDCGFIYITGDLSKIELHNDPEYFRICFNQHSVVTQITCFTRRIIDVNNYRSLWGKHEKMLKNLFLRYKMRAINNFYEYFHNPYFCALYIDSFAHMEEKMNVIVRLLTAVENDSLIEDLIRLFNENEWRRLQDVEKASVMKRFTNSGYHTLLIETVMDFIGENIKYLPVYAHPLITKILLHNYENSPLFIKPD